MGVSCRILHVGVVVSFAACHGGGGSNSDGGGSDVATFDAAPIDAPGMTPNVTGIGGPPAGTCVDGWCWVYPLPQGRALVDIWAASPTDVWTINADGFLLHFNGTVWTNHGFGTWGSGGSHGSSLLVGAASNDVWASTGGGVLHWDGSTWTNTSGPLTSPLARVSATSVWAGATSEWNGSTWVTHPDPGFTPLAIGGSPGTVLAVSNTGRIVQWLGSSWGIADSGSHACNAAAVIDGTHIVVAQDGAISFWDNGTWTTRTPPVNASWDEITATSPNDVWISSFGMGAYHRYHWNGSTWTSATDSTGYGYAMAVDGAGHLFVARSDASVRMYDGSSWSSLMTGGNNGHSVWGTAPDELWYVQTNGSGTSSALHWDGSSWTDTGLPYQQNYTLAARAWGSGPNDFWIGAGHQDSFNVVSRRLLHWDGSAWSELTGLGTENGVTEPFGFDAIWGTAADNVYAVARTALYHRDASLNWSVVPGVPGGRDVFGTSTSDVYVVNGTTLWHFNGSAWSSKTTPASFNRGWANAPNDVWLGNGQIYHYDGTFFSTTVHDGSIAIGSTNNMYTFSPAAHWTAGFEGTSTSFAQPFGPHSGWIAPDGHIWVAGEGGLLVH